MSDESVPKQIRDAIEASEYPELTVREVTQRTGLTEQQVYSAAGSMARLELDQRVGVVRLAEDDGGEFVDDAEHELVTDGGLYEKYEVRKDGEPVEDCFVLEPESDSAAREALIEYAEHTDDDELATDLREWIIDICTQGEPAAGDDPSAALRDLHDRFTSLEHAVEEAVQDLRLGRNVDDVAAELSIALEGGDDGE